MRSLLPTVLPAALSACASTAPPAPPPEAPARHGLVTAATTSQVAGGRTLTQSYAHAAFFDLGDTARPCEQRSAGGCTLYRCRAGAGTARVTDAGVLTLGSGAEAITLTPRAGGGYEAFSHGGAALWRAGQALPLRAAGGLVPAFATELTVPAAGFQLQQPEISAVLSLTVERGRDLAIAYGGTGGAVRLVLVQDILDDPRAVGTYLTCALPEGPAAGAVPAALLGEFQATVGSAHAALLLVGPAAERRIEAGDFAVAAAVIGGGAAATVTLR